jgi:hypothetical protein
MLKQKLKLLRNPKHEGDDVHLVVKVQQKGEVAELKDVELAVKNAEVAELKDVELAVKNAEVAELKDVDDVKLPPILFFQLSDFRLINC